MRGIQIKPTRDSSPVSRLVWLGGSFQGTPPVQIRTLAVLFTARIIDQVAFNEEMLVIDKSGLSPFHYFAVQRGKHFLNGPRCAGPMDGQS